MPTVEELLVQAETGSFVGGMNAATQAVNRYADGLERSASKTAEFDQNIQKTGRSFSSVSRNLSGAAAEAGKLEQANRRLDASLQSIALQERKLGGATAETIELRKRAQQQYDAEVQKAAELGRAIEEKFVAPQNNAAASSKRLQFAMRDVGLQSIDLVQGIATGQPILRTFIQQGAQVAQVNAAMGVSFRETAAGVGRFVLGLATNPLVLFGAAAAAVVGGVVALGAASESTARQTAQLQTQLRATRNDYVALAADVRAAAKEVAASTGIGTGQALAAGKAIAASPNFAGSRAELTELIKLSADLDAVFDKAGDGAARLAKALQDPAAVAKQLADDHFPGMTAALEHSIERMQNAGNVTGAYNAVLGVLRDSAKGAREDGLTPLQQSIERLIQTLTGGTQSGRSFADQIGAGVAAAAKKAIDWVNDLIKSLTELREFVNRYVPGFGSLSGADRPPSPPQRGGRIAEIAGTLPGESTAMFRDAPDSFVAAGGVEDAYRAWAANNERRNEDLRFANGIVASSPAGNIEKLNDQLTRLRAAQQETDRSTSDGAAEWAKYGTAIKAVEKDLADAQKKLDGTTEKTDRTTDSFAKQSLQIDAQIKEQRDLAVAYGQGDAAVQRVIATQKAEHDLIEAGIKKGAEYNVQLAVRTQRYLELSAATGGAALEKTIANTDQATEAQLRINAAWDGSFESLEKLQNLEKARAAAIADHLVPGQQNYNEAVEKYSAALDRGSAASRAFHQAQESVRALADIASTSFDRLGQALVDGFIVNGGKAINVGNILKGVLGSVVAKFAKLAVLNPLLNSILPTSNLRPTLGAALSVLGGGGSASGTGSGGGGIGGLFDQVSNLFNLGRISDALGLTNIGSSLGLTGSDGIFSGVGSLLNSGFFGTSAIEGTNLALGGLASSGVGFGPATAAEVAAQTTGLFGGASIGSSLSAISSALAPIGAGFGAGMFAGGLVQNALGKTGPGNLIGAAAGTAIGTLILPGVGSVIGGLIGGAGGGLFGPKKPSPYTYTAVDLLATGRLGQGPSASQILPSNADAVGNEINQLNAALDALGVKITSLTTRLGESTPGSGRVAFGQGSEKDTNLVGPDIPAVFGGFRFSAENAELNAKIQDQSFASLEALQQVVQQFNAVQAQMTEFLDSTVVSMTKVEAATGSLTAQAAQVVAPFDAAIDAARQFAASGDASAEQLKRLTQAETDLTAARERSVQALGEAAIKRFTDADNELYIRYLNAKASNDNSPTQARDAALWAFDISAERQKQEFSDALVATWGEATKTTLGYANQMGVIERTLAEERLSIVKQYEAQAAATEKALADERLSQARATVTSLTDYVRTLQFGSQSPLSATAQYQLAGANFGAVAAGGYATLGQLPGAGDALLAASRAVNGSGPGYAADFRRVLETIQRALPSVSDQLSIAREQTDAITGGSSLADLAALLRSLLSAMETNGRAPPRLAA